jgi:hypothetical protein
VLELARSQSVIVSCLDDPDALDAMPPVGGAFTARIAPDELWLIGPASSTEALMAHATQHLERPGGYGIVTNVTDAWSVLTVSGAGMATVWERFSENPMPANRPGFHQGAIAFVAAKAIVCSSLIHFFTPAPQGHHLPQRILHGCADQSPRLTGACEFSLEPGGTVEAGTR